MFVLRSDKQGKQGEKKEDRRGRNSDKDKNSSELRRARYVPGMVGSASQSQGLGTIRYPFYR